MAGAGNKLFTSGSVLTASDVNTYLMDQTIMRFTSTTTRDAAFGGAGEATLAEGMFAYTTDTNTLWLYNGSSWVNLLGSDIGEQALSNRNVVINGAMQVAQRGTSVAGITTSGYYTADRYTPFITTMGTWTQSVEADAPTGSGFRKSLKMLCTTADASPAAGDVINMRQLFEGQNLQQFLKGTASAKQWSISFWVKANVTGTYIVNLYDYNNNREVSASYSISASATWEKKTIAFPADTTGALNNDNATALEIGFYLGAGSSFTSGTLNTVWSAANAANRAVGQTNLAAATSNYWQITGVQLEAGSVATPFEFEQYSETLAKCQRYYWQWDFGGATSYAQIASGHNSGTSSVLCTLRYPVVMRAIPSAIGFSAANTFYVDRAAGGGTATAITASRASNVAFLIDATLAGGTSGQGAGITQDASDTAYITVSAEL